MTKARCQTLLSLQVNIGIRVLTRPTPAKLPEIYRTLGTDYGERVLPSIIQVQAQEQQASVLLGVHATLNARQSSTTCAAHPARPLQAAWPRLVSRLSLALSRLFLPVLQ